MPFPAGAQTITLTGTLTVPVGGTASAGKVVLTPSARLVDSGNNRIYAGGGTITLDANGAFSTTLLRTDSAGVAPAGWRWRVDEQPNGGPRATYWIELTAAHGATVDLADVAAVAAPDGSSLGAPPSGVAGGDLSGSYPNPVVAKVAGASVSGTPTAGYVLTATSGSAATWQAPFTQAAADGRYLLLTGGTVTGDLTLSGSGSDLTVGGRGSMVNASGSATYAALPKGIVGRSENAGLIIGSSYAGGDDDGVGTDSTGRLNLYSYQRANVGSFGETIRHFLMRRDAKAMEAWYGPQSGTTAAYDASRNWVAGSSPKPWCWTGAHYEANDHGSIHGHWEVEVPDLTGALQGRLEVPFVDQEGDTSVIGVAVTNIRTNLADLSIRANLGAQGVGYLRIGGGNSVPKELLLSISSDRATSGRRWGVRANTTTESGANIGTDFEVVRYSDTGVELGAGMVIRRSTGQVAFGSSTVTGGSVRVSWATSGQHGYYATPTSSPGSAAAFATLLTATTDRAMDVRVANDTNARLIVWADGALEFGDGSTRDTKLYRDGANSLKTDDALTVALAFKHLGTTLGFYGATAASKPAVSGAKGGNAALASLLTALSTLGLITDSTTA